MAEEKHKGSEFSNISQIWEQNERNKAEEAEIQDKGNEFYNVSEVWAQNEKNKAEGDAPGKEEDSYKETLGNDYWDRVAEDPASGYKNKEDENNILNIDQVPGDNERENKGSEE